MAIIALKAWYLPAYEPLTQLEQRPYDLRLSKNSLLKAGLRADFLDDSDIVRQSVWFQRYLGENRSSFTLRVVGVTRSPILT
jgi:hypothetical protein